MSRKEMQFNRSLGPLRISGDMRAVLAGLVLFALLVNLGSWQLGRAGEKSALASRWEARAAMPAVAPESLLPDAPSVEVAAALADRQVQWQASFTTNDYLLLDNRLHRGQVGYHVVALAESNAGLIPVNLGWLAGDPSRRTTPIPTFPEGRVAIEGRIYVPSGTPLLMQKPEPPVALPATVQTLYWDNWQGSLEALSGRAVFPFQVRIQPDSPYALLAEWAVVNQSPSKHIGYAVQWFAMATVLVIIGLLRLTNLRSLLSGSRTHD